MGSLYGFPSIPVKNKLPLLAALLIVGCLLLLVPQETALSKQESSVLIDPYGDSAHTHTLVLKGVRLEGNRLLKSEELAAITSRFVNVELNYQDLMEIKAEIEAHYARQNLAAVVLIPPQDLGDGVLKVELVESELTDKELARALVDFKSAKTQVR
jgi:hemolysin activation/secretion protein